MGHASGGDDRFFLAHLPFLIVFIALVWAWIVVLRRRRSPVPLALATIPLALIFVTAFVAAKFPLVHRGVNLLYDGLLVWNAIYFWAGEPRLLRWLYVAAALGTAFDFAMHFVLHIAR